VLRLFAENKIAPVLGPQFPLTQGADAHRALEAREVIGKIVLKP
jgi:NADPH2:quinone reductase